MYTQSLNHLENTIKNIIWNYIKGFTIIFGISPIMQLVSGYPCSVPGYPCSIPAIFLAVPTPSLSIPAPSLAVPAPSLYSVYPYSILGCPWCISYPQFVFGMSKCVQSQHLFQVQDACALARAVVKEISFYKKVQKDGESEGDQDV